MSETLLRRHLATLEGLEAQLDRFSDAAWTRPLPEGGWCAAEIYDHIGKITLRYAAPRIERCLGGGAPGARRTLGGWLLRHASWIAGSFRLRQSFPPELQVRVLARAEARALLAELRMWSELTATRVATADPRVRVRHVRLGALNANEWFAFTELHARHHLKGQLRRLLDRLD
jgi:hypothetical protein